MEWVELLLPIVRDLVIVIVITVVGYSLKFWRELTLEQWVKELVIDSVLFIQEKYWNLSGEQKFAEAKKWLLRQLNERGIKVDEEWLDALIDATVKELRAQFGDEHWYRGEVK